MIFKLKILFYWLRFLWHKKPQNQQELVKFQQKQLRRFYKNVLAKSVFYQAYFKNGEFKFQDVPIISKATFLDNFNAINTVGIQKEQALEVALSAEKSRDFRSEISGITVGLSTGTSGKRGVFLASENERAKWVALVMQRVIKPVLFKKQKIAFFLRANSNLYASVNSALFEFQYFDIFHPIDDLLLALNTFQPHIVAAQPSILTEIALAQANKKIQILPIQIISFAEVLQPNDKQFIQNQFLGRFTEIYQCTEGFLASTCSHGTMHLHEDLVYFEKEWIDKQRFYPIITDFSRESQPIVRYRLDDVLVQSSQPCPCGSPHTAIEAISGRNDDVLVFRTSDKIVKLYPDLIARRIAIANDDFYKYQIKQTAYDCIEISIDAASDKFETLKGYFSEVLQTLFLEKGIEGVELIFKDSLTIEAGNKYRKILKAFRTENL